MATEHDPFAHNVSVIVLNFNQAATTVECLDALATAPSELIREIIVVDNGSDPEELSILRQRCTGDTRGRHRGHSPSSRSGSIASSAKATTSGSTSRSGDYIVFLNNDAFVQPGWIEALSSTMRSDPLVAAVGPMFLYPDGRVQEVGGVIVPTGDAVQIGKGAVWGPDHYDTPCLVDYCSAACIMMRRSDFLKVGGFGLEWEPAYYEDTDLCLKLWTRCGKVMVNPNARVVHIESKTTSDSRLKLHDISEINRARFVKKWGPWLEARQTAHLTTMALAPRGEVAELGTADLDLRLATRTAPDSQFVLYSPYQLVPGGGERMLFELASVMSALVGTQNVVFASRYRYSSIRIRQIEATFGFDNVIGTGAARGRRSSRATSGSPLSSATPSCPRSKPSATRSVYHIQFPFWIPDQEVEEHGGLLAGYDEIWVYSEFVRRNVNGLIRHYGLDAPPIRLIPPHASWSGSRPGDSPGPSAGPS